MKNILLFIMIIFAFIACEDVNDKHEEYLLEGSPTYAGKIDSVDCYSGFYKVKVSIYPSVDVNRKEFRVYWNNFQDSVVVPYNEDYYNETTGWYDVIIEGFQSKLIEGYTTLSFRNYDIYGNKSRQSESTVQIYGNDFASNLLSQGVTGFDGQYLNFANRNGVVGLLLEYTTNQGTQSTIEYKQPIEKLKIIGLESDLPDFKSNTKVKYKSLFYFEKTDLDSIYASNFSESNPIILPDPLILESELVHKYGFEETFSFMAEVYEGESFTSTSDQTWCTVTDNNETGNIEVTVTANASSSRTATVTVSVDGKTGDKFTKSFQITQSDAIRLDDTKSEWTETGLADENASAWGWTLPHLWDGNNGGTGFHTETVSPPILFSVNFGQQLQIDGVEIVPRSTNIRNPEIYEVWASNTATEVGVERDSDEWETKAVEAGWVKLKTVEYDVWKDNNSRIGHIGATEKYQYMRIRVLKNSAGNLAPMNLMEMSIIGYE